MSGTYLKPIIAPAQYVVPATSNAGAGAQTTMGPNGQVYTYRVVQAPHTTAPASPTIRSAGYPTVSSPVSQRSIFGAPVSHTASLEKRLADLEIDKANRTHSAFVFIKPHAVTDAVKKLVREHLDKEGIYVVSEGAIMAEQIDSKQLIDTHYGAIAEKAVKLKPAALTVQPKAQEEFQSAFGLTWEDALAQGLVFNAMDAAAQLGITTQELGVKWGHCQKGTTLLKFGGGFYCGKVDSIFVINGFYMDMRGKFTTPGTSIYYFESEWDPRRLKWEDFRGKVLGGTNPKEAAHGSLRNIIYHDWRKLGLQAVPDTGDNGVHASASPFEALAERNNWLGVPITDDFYGRAMLASGIPIPMVQEWTSDPGVNFEGKKQSLFDLLEDLDARDCLKKSKLIAAANR